MSRPGRAVRLLVAVGVRAAPGWFAVALAVTVAAAVFLTVYAVGFRIVLDGALDGHPGRVVGGALLAAGCWSVGWICQVLAANVTFELTDRVGLAVAERIARAVAAVPGVGPFEDPDRRRELDLLRTRQNQLAGVPRQALSVLQVALRLVAVTVLLGAVHPALALLPLAGVLPWFAERASAARRERADRDLNPQRRLADALFRVGVRPSAGLELRVYGYGPTLLRRHADAAAAVVRATTRSAVTGGALRAAGWLAFTAVLVAGVGFAVLQTVRGRASAGELLMVVTLLRRIQMQFSQVATAATELTAAWSTALRLVRLDEEGTGGDAPAAVPAPRRLVDGIRLRGVGFSHPDRPGVLRDVDLHLPAGAVVALVGDNGAGKSTLVSLLTGMRRPDDGHVLADGVDVHRCDPGDWRRGVSGVLQAFGRFELTARGTVEIGDLDRADDPSSVPDALRRADATAVVDALPQGPDTRLGTASWAGAELSGGQWQRLALARGLNRRDPVLRVLDEPGAALDPIAERDLFERCAREARDAGRRAGTVTLLVTHRLSTARIADLIVVLDAGRVVEVGPHEELVTAGGGYTARFAEQVEAYR